MDNISKKIINGEELRSEEWKQFLLNYHKFHTGITYEIFKNFKNQEGYNSYQIMCNEIAFPTTKKVELLEIACGNGVIAQYFQEKKKSNLRYTGIDMSPHQIELARTRYGKKNIDFKVEDAGELSFNDSQFDYIVCHLAFMLLNPVEKALTQIERVLKPNGYFLAIVNSRKIKDKLLREIMIEVGQFIRSKCPAFGIKNGGNSKTYDKNGIDFLLKDFPTLSKNIEVIEFELVGKMTIDEFWELISSSYGVFSLPPNYFKELKELVFKKLKSMKTEGKYFEIKYPFNLYKIQKS